MLQVLDNHPLQVMLFIYKFECDLGYTVLPLAIWMKSTFSPDNVVQYTQIECWRKQSFLTRHPIWRFLDEE